MTFISVMFVMSVLSLMSAMFVMSSMPFIFFKPQVYHGDLCCYVVKVMFVISVISSMSVISVVYAKSVVSTDCQDQYLKTRPRPGLDPYESCKQDRD